MGFPMSLTPFRTKSTLFRRQVMSVSLFSQRGILGSRVCLLFNDSFGEGTKYKGGGCVSGTRKVCMLCPVGTSLGGNLDRNDTKTKEATETLSKPESAALFQRENVDTQAYPFLSGYLNPRSKASWELIYRGVPEDSSGHVRAKRYPTAELQSTVRWLADLEDKDAFSHPLSLRFVFFHSEALMSRKTAELAGLYLQLLLGPERTNNFFRSSLAEKNPIEIEELAIKVNDRQSFLKSVSELFERFDFYLEEARKNDEEVIINTSGGYKGLAAYSVLYAQLHELPAIYSFEAEDSRSVELAALPVSYAISELDEEMNVLKALHAGGPEVEGFLEKCAGSLPPWMHSLLTDERKPSFGGLTKTLLERHGKKREYEGGHGRFLLGKLRDCGSEGRRYAEYLQKRIAGNWSELWLGDQIPETVEHSRRHSKRLMEVAGNLFRCVPDTLEKLGMFEPKVLALFIACIYLHDIGHTAVSFPVRKDGSGAFPLGLFPSAVREVHHILSRDMILEFADDLFDSKGSEEAALDVGFLKKLVPLVCSYHRGYTKLENDGVAQPNRAIQSVGRFLYEESFETTLSPLEKTCASEYIYNLSVNKVLIAAALLRIIDGCDVQVDRTVDAVYFDARKRRTLLEARHLGNRLAGLKGTLPDSLEKTCLEVTQTGERLFGNNSENEKESLDAFGETIKGIYPKVFEALDALKKTAGGMRLMENHSPKLFHALSLANRVAFKWEQFLHFDKHRLVSTVLPVPGDTENSVVMTIFPQETGGDSRKEFQSLRDDKLKDIRKDIQNEYDKVSHILLGNLTVKVDVASSSGKLRTEENDGSIIH